MARQPVPELGPGWEYEDAPADPGNSSEKSQRWRADWAKQQGNGGHFIEQGKKKYYQLVKIRN